MDPSTLAQLLSGVFSGAAGISQLGQSGTNAAAGAAAASPFQSQYAQYQPQVQQQLGTTAQQAVAGSNQATDVANRLTNANTTVTGNAGALGTVANLTGAQNEGIWDIQGANPNVTGPGAAQLGSAASLESQLNALSTNYMSNPAIQAQYQLGLQSVNRGAAASGTSVSGGAMAELEKYGQQYASGAYQQTFNDILAGNSQAFTQGATNTSQTQAAQQGTFNNNVTQGQGVIAGLQTQVQNEFGLNQAAVTNQQSSITNQIQAAATEGGIYNTAAGTLNNANQGMLSSLGQLSGATTGSPAQAGAILSGQFANTNTALGNVGAGITSAGTGISSLLSSLFGKSGSSLLSGTTFDTSGITGNLSNIFSGLGGSSQIGDLFSQLGASTTGGFSSLVAGGADTGISSGLSALMGL